jgi:hypothetical protein
VCAFNNLYREGVSAMRLRGQLSTAEAKANLEMLIEKWADWQSD